MAASVFPTVHLNGVTLRRCLRCGVDRHAVDFHKGPSSRPCKPCRKEEAAAIYLENKAAILARNKRWRARCPETESARHERWRSINAQKEKDRHARFYLVNIEAMRRRNAARYAADPKKCISETYASHRKRLARDPAYKLRGLIAKRIGRALKQAKANRSTRQLVGYSIDELRQHIEAQFLPWMAWDNHGVAWEIDHRQPVSSFDFSDPAQIKACWALGNLRPLEKSLNRIKGARPESGHEQERIADQGGGR